MPTYDLTVLDRGCVARRLIMLTKGAYLGNGADTPDRILAEMDRLKDMAGMMEPAEGADQYRHEFTMAGQARAKV